jgi:hypothetical protein
MSQKQDNNEDRPILDAFLGICLGVSLLVGLVGFVIGSQGTMALGGAVQFGFFGGVAVFATACTFAPNRTLTNPKIAANIGTKNPVVARIVCAILAFVLWGMLIATFMASK